MREARYRFPNEVRTTTRAMAAQMIEEGNPVATPEAMDAWITAHPEIESSLTRGGYGKEFNAADLFPLLHVLLPLPAVIPAPAAKASSPRRTIWVLAAVAAVLLVVILGIALGQ